MKKIKMLLGFVAVVAVIAVFFTLKPRRAQAWDGAVSGRVTLVGVGGGGAAYIKLEGNPNLCTNSTDKTVGLVYNPPQTTIDRQSSEAIISMLVSAKLSGKTVRVYSTNNSGNWGCVVGFVEVP
jgi:hypothetical protein